MASIQRTGAPSSTQPPITDTCGSPNSCSAEQKDNEPETDGARRGGGGQQGEKRRRGAGGEEEEEERRRGAAGREEEEQGRRGGGRVQEGRRGRSRRAGGAGGGGRHIQAEMRAVKTPLWLQLAGSWCQTRLVELPATHVIRSGGGAWCPVPREGTERAQFGSAQLRALSAVMGPSGARSVSPACA